MEWPIEDDLSNDSFLGRLLEEVSWEKAIDYRHGGRRREKRPDGRGLAAIVVPRAAPEWHNRHPDSNSTGGLSSDVLSRQ
jgi:hypothetical protein